MAFKISSPGIERLMKTITKQKGMDWRHTRMAMEQVAEIAIQQWQEKARNPDDNHAKWFGRQYANSITIKNKNFGNNEMGITIGPVGKGLGAAKVIEKGRGAYDMKPALLRSDRARRGKKGTYTIIGFRHGMEVIVKAGVANDFRELKSTTKVGNRIEIGGAGKAVQRNVYSMSSEGFGKSLGRVTSVDKNGHKRDHLSGLTKTKQKTKGGGSQYQGVTFRVVSSNSTGWIFPAISPQNIKEEVYKLIEKEGAEVMHNAIKTDLLKWLSGDKK